MADPLLAIKTILDANWNNSNTDSITPVIEPIVEHKTIDLANNDYILLYEIDEGIDPFGIGAQEWAHDKIFALDIRTTYKRAAIPDIRAHLEKIKDEVLRIIKANVADPDANHHLLLPKRKKDLSDKSIGLGRMVIDTNLKYWGE